MKLNKVILFLAMGVLVSMGGCVATGGTDWQIDIKVNDVEQSGDYYVFNGTIIRSGDVGITEGHTVEGVRVEYLTKEKQLIKEVELGTLSYPSKTPIRTRLSQKPWYVLVKFDTASSEVDAGSGSGLQLKRYEGELSYWEYDDYEAQY